ncbi:MAG: CRISPR-associated endoribonuclease Cas6 [Thermoprotei archaeon]|nr:MAG: CRISPR-associated endoribonuclease Cas6 [Thermoprotei archaeon]
MLWLRINAVLKPHSNIIIQPYSGRVVRQILFKLASILGLNDFLNILSSNAPFKPYSFTPLFLDGKPLYKSPDDSNPLILYADKRYRFTFSYILNNVDDIAFLKGFQDSVEIYGSRKIDLVLDRINVIDESMMDLGLKYGDYVKMVFVTPTLLQLPKIRKMSKINRYMLFPIPSLIFYSLKRHWNTYAEEKIRLETWRTNYSLRVVNYSLRPRTVLYDKNTEIRGFIGYTIFQILSRGKNILEKISKLLYYATIVNIGKSRSIGFGVTKIKLINKV